MQIEYQPGDYREIACDLLAYPVFEDEDKGSSLAILWTKSLAEQSSPFFPPENSNLICIKPAESSNPRA